MTTSEQTHGSPQRPARELAGTLQMLGVGEVIERLRSEPAFSTDGRNSQTILHDGSARVVIIAIDEGRDVGPQTSDGAIVLVLIDGEGTLEQAGQASCAEAGSVAILLPRTAWSFRATAPSSIVACFWQPD